MLCIFVAYFAVVVKFFATEASHFIIIIIYVLQIRGPHPLKTWQERKYWVKATVAFCFSLSWWWMRCTFVQVTSKAFCARRFFNVSRSWPYQIYSTSICYRAAEWMYEKCFNDFLSLRIGIQERLILIYTFSCGSVGRILKQNGKKYKTGPAETKTSS